MNYHVTHVRAYRMVAQARFELAPANFYPSIT